MSEEKKTRIDHASTSPGALEASSMSDEPPIHTSVAIDSDEKVPPAAALTGTYASSTMILFNSIMGPSILAIPWTIAQTGWVVGLITLALAALLTQLGASLLLWCGALVEGPGRGRAGLKEIAARATPGRHQLPEVMVVLNCLGCAIGSLVVIGQIIPRTIRRIAILVHDHATLHQPLLFNRKLWIGVVVVLLSPLCLCKSLHGLRHTGLVCVMCMGYVALCITTLFFNPQLQGCGAPPGTSVSVPSVCSHGVVAFAPPDRLLDAITTTLPIYLVAYTINFQVFPVYDALRVRRLGTMQRCVASALGMAFLTYATIGLLAYWTYGAHLSSTFMRSYPNTVVLDIARVGLCLVVCMIYPIVVFMARASLLTLLSGLSKPPLPPRPLFYLLTAAILGFTLLVSLFTPNLSIVLSVVGAIATIPMTLVLPGLYLAKLSKDRRWAWCGTGVAALGVALSALGLYCTFAP